MLPRRRQAGAFVDVALHVVEHDVGDMATSLAHLLVGAAGRYAGRVHRHDESADMRVLGLRVLLGAGHDQPDIGMRGIGDVALGPVEDPAIALGIGPRSGRHGGAVAARTGFGQAEAGDRALGDPGPPFRLLRVGPAILDRRIEHAHIDREDRAIGGRGIGHRLHDLGILGGVEAGAAEILGHGQAEQPHLLHFRDDIVGDAVVGDDFGLGRDQPFADIAFELVEELVCSLAEKFFGTLQIEHKDEEGEVIRTIDLSRPWKRRPYRELVCEAAGEDWFDLSPDERRARAETDFNLEIGAELEDYEVTQQVFEKLVEEHTFDPCYVTHVDAKLIPLAKLNEADPGTIDVYELIINGQEISPGYSELNDPDSQRSRFEEQSGGEAQEIDEDFVETLEHGMPPAGGIGIGIDRLIMLLTGAPTIRDVILFPQLKRKD